VCHPRRHWRARPVPARPLPSQARLGSRPQLGRPASTLGSPAMMFAACHLWNACSLCPFHPTWLAFDGRATTKCRARLSASTEYEAESARPFEVTAALIGVYRVSRPVAEEDYPRFSAVYGIPLLWPFIRESFAELTIRAAGQGSSSSRSTSRCDLSRVRRFRCFIAAPGWLGGRAARRTEEHVPGRGSETPVPQTEVRIPSLPPEV
jgi:hypothetical protein